MTPRRSTHDRLEPDAHGARPGAENRAAVRAVRREDPRARGALDPVGRRARLHGRGRYTARGWTEWTQGFQFGAAILQFDATGDASSSSSAATRTVERMASHLTHIGVHDHGFNNVSTYGNLLRLVREGRIDARTGSCRFYELALKVSGAVQARALDAPSPGGGYIYSFNGAHSLFVDTIRSLRALALGHRLGHVLMGEQDRQVGCWTGCSSTRSATAECNVYYGAGRDAYDVRGRVAHESLFNAANGAYRCPSSQQGYSPFTTWTRGLAWAVLGFAEQLEFLATLSDDELSPGGGRGRRSIAGCSRRRWRPPTSTSRSPPATACPTGTPARRAWPRSATGAAVRPIRSTTTSRWTAPPRRSRPRACCASAAASRARGGDGARYEQAGLRVARHAVRSAGPYLSTDARHEGLLLHSVYHRPNSWDHIPPGSRIPRGESSQWGDYHAREAALYVLRLARGEPYLAFFGR